jgi:UDP-3-O-[3-hydroxymyristoyl] glucosamine N-acyltransferase LpxD
MGLKLFNDLRNIKCTASIEDVVDNCLTFAKTSDNLTKLLDVSLNVDVIVPFDVNEDICNNLPKNIKIHRVDIHEDVKNIFIQLHNKINENIPPKENVISKTAFIDPSAIIGIPGNNITKMKDGRIINMKHMGNVIIEDYAEVQALSIVHRGVFSSTIIRKNTQIFAKVNIGHNCDIGESTIICPGSLIAGGTKIGKNCYIWQGVITRSNINICDNVIVGAGSIVLKDIKIPGVYVGSPAQYLKEYQEDLR